MTGAAKDDCQHLIVQEVETASGRKLACQECGKILASGQEQQEPMVQAEPKVTTPDDIEPDKPASGLAELLKNICQSEAVTGKHHDRYMDQETFLGQHHVIPQDGIPDGQELYEARDSHAEETAFHARSKPQATLDQFEVS